MKFQVIGENRDSGARMMLELEAESKAAAERKAINQNMRVHRVIDISDGVPSQSHEPNPRAGNVYRSGGGKVKGIILLLILLAVVWYFRSWIMWRLGMR
jgi:hypothetical protein